MLSLFPSAEQWLCVELLLFNPRHGFVRDRLLFPFANEETEAKRRPGTTVSVHGGIWA